jgi:adenylate cyclase
VKGAAPGAKKVTIEKENTTIVNGAGKKSDIEARIGQIKAHETYALVRDMVVAQALSPITMKGIAREVIPYAIQSVFDSTGKNIEVFSEHITGLDFYFNASMIDANNATLVRNVLQDALKALDKRTTPTS